jgi:hypothetical protein
MRRIGLCFAILLIAAACMPATPSGNSVTTAVSPAASGVQYPASFREDFVQYLTVDRKDAVVRHIYVNPEALDSIRGSRRVPDNTIIVIEAFDAQRDKNGDPIRDELGHFVAGEPLEMIHVAQKRGNWQASDFPSEARAGQWNFGSFEYTTGAAFDEDLTACFNCHSSAPATDFLYSGNFLAQFSLGSDVLYTYCDQRRRVICRG